jgi:hypothetical protein
MDACINFWAKPEPPLGSDIEINRAGGRSGGDCRAEKQQPPDNYQQRHSISFEVWRSYAAVQLDNPVSTVVAVDPSLPHKEGGIRTH